MIKIEYFNAEQRLSAKEFDAVADFLHTQLGQYGDPRHQIVMAMEHALGCQPQGGLITAAYQEGTLVGVMVINRTGMAEYIPENIAVYLAVDSQCRGCGVGRQLMTATLQRIEGNIALHVEPENPAIKLYQSLGFSSKYLEMRLIRGEQ